MANIKSAKKRISTNQRQRSENKYVKSTIATMTKSFRKLIADNKLAEAQAKLTETISYIDSACSKGVLHRNNASRHVARLSAALDAAKKANGVTEAPAPKKAPAKKVAATTEEVKAEPVKKPAAKKATTAKAATTKKASTAKKTTAKASEEKPAAKKAATKTTTKKASK